MLVKPREVLLAQALLDGPRQQARGERAVGARLPGLAGHIGRHRQILGEVGGARAAIEGARYDMVGEPLLADEAARVAGVEDGNGGFERDAEPLGQPAALGGGQEDGMQIMLWISFMAWPAPVSPTWKTWSAMCRKSGRHASRTAPSPPTIRVMVPASAALAPPVMPQSR